jgi:hypothetical protein
MVIKNVLVQENLWVSEEYMLNNLIMPCTEILTIRYPTIGQFKYHKDPILHHLLPSLSCKMLFQKEGEQQG